MKDLVVHRDNKPIYNIVYSDSFDELPDLLIDLGYSNRKICIVTETNVASLYLDAILLSVKDKFASVTAFTFPEGEASKNLDVVRDLYEKLIQEKFDRNQKGFDKALQERLEEMFIKETFQQDPNDFIILGVDLAIEKDKGANYDLQ